MDAVYDATGALDSVFERRLFDRAVAHWNAGRFHEAHEDWETLWNEAEGARRLWLQGLIQYAAAFHHFQVTGSASGFAKLMRSASEKCEPYAGDTLGMDFARLRSDLDAWRVHGARVAEGASLRASAPREPPTIGYLPGRSPDPFPPDASPPEPEEPDDDGSA